MQRLLELRRWLEPLAKLDAVRRLGAAQRMSSSSMGGSWIWIVMILGGLLLATGAAVGLVTYVRTRRRRAWQAFEKRARETGLTEEERSLLSKMVLQAGIAPPVDVFTSEEGFKRVMAAAASAGPAHSTSGAAPTGVCGQCVHVRMLCDKLEKLGFQVPRDDSDLISIDLGPTADSNALASLRRDGGRALEKATVRVNPVEVWQGESLLVRYPKGNVMWEFDAWLSSAEEELVVRPFGAARWVDRRRFERVPTDTLAYVAPFTFERAEPVGEAHRFVAARLTEIAAIGLRFIAPVEAQVGQRMLVVLVLSDQRHVEAMGIVRRCWEETEEGHDFAVELVGLHSDEVEQLARETEAVKNAAALEKAPAEAAAVAQG